MRLTAMFALLFATTIARADSPDVRILEGHEGTVRPAFSPDGKTVATASDDQTIRLWDAETGKQHRILGGHNAGVWRVAYAPDGKMLAGVAGKRVFLWDPAVGEIVRQLEGHADTIRALGFSPDGRILVTGGNDETVRFWETSTGAMKRTLKIDRQGDLAEIVWSVAVAPDGKTLAIGSGNGIGGDGHIRVIDMSNGAVLQRFAGPEGKQIWAVAFSPDGKRLASGSFLNGQVSIRSTDTWKVEREWVGGGSLRALAFSPDGKTVAAAIDRQVVLWDAATGEMRRTLSGHSNWVMQIAFSPDGKSLVSGGSDHTARLWKLE